MATFPPLCPVHGTGLESRGTLWHCEACGRHYQLIGLCNKCGGDLEKLCACGAVNWFCNHCNELKSKSTVEYRVEPAD